MLDGDHARLVEAALPVCATYGLAIAGGYAIKAHGLVTRPSEDIDFATAATAPLDEIMRALADAYTQAGYEVQVLDVDARKGHLLGCPPDQIADVRVWAQEWSTQIGLDIAEAEPWSDDDE